LKHYADIWCYCLLNLCCWSGDQQQHGHTIEHFANDTQRSAGLGSWLFNRVTICTVQLSFIIIEKTVLRFWSIMLISDALKLSCWSGDQQQHGNKANPKWSRT
jgi:hypothetical protein